MSASGFDIARAKLRVDEILANLAALPAGSAKYAELRADGIRAGMLVKEIGHMLGLG